MRALLIAALASLVALPASAATITFGTTLVDGANGAVSDRAGITDEQRFDGAPSSIVVGFADGLPRTGSLVNEYLAPVGNTTTYLAVRPLGGDLIGDDGQSGLTLGPLASDTFVNYFGFVWGSVDSYNSVFFLNGFGQQITVPGFETIITGTAIAEAAGIAVNATVELFVNVAFTEADDVAFVRFGTSNFAMEVDNAVYRSVPNGTLDVIAASDPSRPLFAAGRAGIPTLVVPAPASLGLLGTALALVAMARRRRRG